MKMSGFRWTGLLLVILLCTSAGIVRAQQLATLSGIVTDSSSAVVPGADVKLVNTHTGEDYVALTNENGHYTIPLIKPGSYELNVTAQGFKQYKQAGIQLETGTPARIDVGLELGQVSEVVKVEAAAPLLQTESSSIGSVIRNESIVNLPLINRRAAQLARLSGFVVQNGTGSNFTMAGGRGDNANWTIDGGNAQNILLGVATLNYDPPIDALQEFKVEISNYKAELGRTGGGVVQFTTKGGTNQFHGTLYEFVRNDALDARSFFSVDKPVLRYNQFGGSVGGPVIKDRTHFFFSYEGQQIKRQGVVRQVVPTLAEVQGDFSGTGVTIIDPLTREPFPGNRIPASRIDRVGAAIAALYPEPNIPGAGARKINFQKNRSITSTPDVTVTRIDHAFSSRDKLFGRLLTNLNTPAEGPVYPQPGVDDGHFNQDNHYYSVSGTWFHSFTPAAMMELRYAWDQRKFHNMSGGIDLGLADKVGLKGTNARYFPRVNVTGFPSLGRGEHERLQFPIIGQHMSGSLTQVRGKHTLKFGADFRYSQNTDIPNGNAGGTLGFNTTATGDALAALLLGHGASASRAEVLEVISNAATVGFFGQTDWKVNPKLTLNLGLRWDLDWPRWEANSRQNSFDLTAINPVCNCPGLITWSGRNGLSRYAHNFDKNNFGPRVGFAWNPAEKWVIRGGAALVYIGAYDLATPVRFNIGFSSRVNLTSPDGGRTAALQLGDGLPPVPLPQESDLVPGFGAVAIGAAPVLTAEFLEPTHRPTPYLETFNLNVERQLAGNIVVEVGYLGTLGHKLTPGGDNHSINQVPTNKIRPGNVQSLRPFPQFSDVVVVAHTIGNSVYHGMNIRVDKRFSKGLQFNANYTWAKLIDDVESRNELGGNAGSGAFADQYNRQADRGLSGNHIAHRFIASTVWELPVGRKRLLNIENPVLNQIFGGWTASTIVELRSGSPFGVIENNAAVIYPTAVTVRSNITGPFSKNPNWRRNVLGESYFDTSLFAAPGFGTFGNTGRTLATGRGAVVADLALLKDFNMPWEGHRLQFRTEMLNFPNHANFDLPGQARGNPVFGFINGLAPGNPARIIQFGLHYRF